MSAPQFLGKYRGSQLPEAIHPGAHGFAQSSSGLDNLQHDQDHQAALIRNHKKKKILVICAVILAVLLAAAVGALGGFFGSKRNSDNKTESPRYDCLLFLDHGPVTS